MSELLKHPSIPSAILSFFYNQPDFPALAGDISEEFQQRAQSAGATAAKRWYWREAFRNAWALTEREVLRTPACTILTAIGCLIAVGLATGVFLAIRYYPFQLAPGIGRFLSSWDPTEMARSRRDRDFVLLFQLVAAFATGWIGGKLIPGREWALALMFTFVQACAVLPGAWVLHSLNIPKPLMQVMIISGACRLSGFWLGALWVRRVKGSNTSRSVQITS